MPDNSRKKLYDALTADDFDLGTFEDFDVKMNNPESRKRLYDAVSTDFDLGTYDEFESKISPVQQNPLKKSTTLNTGTFTQDVSEGLGITQPKKPVPTYPTQKPLSQEQLQQQVFKNAPSIGKAETAPAIKKIDITAIPGSKFDLENKKNTYLTQLSKLSSEQNQILSEYEPKITQVQQLRESYEANPTPETAEQLNALITELQPISDRINKINSQANILQAGVRNVINLNQVNLEKDFGIGEKVQVAVGNTVANLVNSAGKIVETIGDYNYELGELIGDSHEENIRTKQFDEKLASDIDGYYKQLQESVNRDVPESYKNYSPISDKLSGDKLLYFGMNSMAQLAPVVAATLATGGAGGVATGFAMEYGGMYDSFHEPLKQKYLSEGLSEEEADKKADLEAGLMASTGSGIIGALDRFGASGLINSTLKKQLLRNVTIDAVEELGEKTAKDAIEKSLLNNIKTFGKGFISATVPEVATEFGQELVAPTEMDIYDYITDGNTFKEGIGNKETWIRAADAGVGALIASAPGGALSGAGRITQQAYIEAMNAQTEQGLNKLVSDIQAEVDAGLVTQEVADNAIQNISKIQETDAKIPVNITDKNARLEAINLINEKEQIAKQIEGKDEALTVPLVKRQEEINKRLTEISEGKINAREEETPTQERTEPIADIGIPEQPTTPATEITEGQTIELPPVSSESTPRTFEYKDGTWKQKIDNEYIDVSDQIKQDVQDAFIKNVVAQQEGEIKNEEIKREEKGQVLSPEGAVSNVTPPYSFGKETGVKHAETEKLRKEFDFPEYEKIQKKQDKLENEASEKLASGYDVKKLISRMERGELPTDVEQIILTKYIAGLADKIEKNPTNELLQEASRAIEASDRIGGSEVARSLAARRKTEIRDETLLDYFIEDIEANEGLMLTESQKAKVEKEYKDITEAKKQLEDKIKSLVEENNKLRAEQEIKKNKASKVKKTHDEYVKEREIIANDIRKKLKELRKETSISLLPYARELIAISPDVAKMVKSYVSEGVVKLDEIVDKIHEILSESIPEINKNDVIAIIAGEYQEKKQKKSRSEINKQIYELRQEAKLIKQIEDIQKGIEPQMPEDKRIQKNKKIEQLRKQIKESDLGRLSDYKKRVTSNILSLEEQLKSEDIKEIEPPKPIKLDVEAIRLKDRYIKLKQEREIRILKEKYKNRSKLERTKDTILDVINVPRTIMSSMDFSAPLRQAAVSTVSHPIIAAGAFTEMFKQAVSQKRFDRWFYDVRNDYRFPAAQEAGLYIADPHDYRLSAKEEAFMSNLAEKIPIIGKLIKGSERAYVSYLNKMRWDLYNNLSEQIEKEGKTPYNSPDTYKGLASFINNATGRGGFGGAFKGLENNTEILNSILFSPRLVASRINFLNPIYYAKLPKDIRMMAIKDVAKFIGVGLSVLFLFKMAGAEVEDDPRSTDFGKIKFGDTRWDIWGGYQQYIRVLTQLITGQTKSASTGKFSTLDGAGAFGRTRGDVLLSFTRGKLAPIPSITVDFLSGRTVTGDKVTVMQEAESHLMPLIYKDLSEAVKDKGVKAIFTVGVPATFGIGVSTYKNRHDKYVIDEIEHPVSEKAKAISEILEKKKLEISEDEKNQEKENLDEIDQEFNTTDQEKKLRETVGKIKNKIPIIISELERIEPQNRSQTLDRWVSIGIAPESTWDYIDITNNGEIVLSEM